MPLYEYSCKKCHREFELLIRGDEDPECPVCGSRRLQKLLSVPAAHTAGGNDMPACPVGASGMCGLGQCGQAGCGMGPV